MEFDIRNRELYNVSLKKGEKEIIIPKGIETISSFAFRDGKGAIESIVIPDSVTTIESYAFWCLKKLKNITIPASVTRIETGAIGWCDALASITVDKNNRVYDSRDNCNAIIETATNTLISGCRNTVIVDTIQKIEDNGFFNCINMTSLTIPASVTSIGNSICYGCDKLVAINVDKNNRVYDSRDNCNAIIETATNTLIQGCQKTIIPDTVTSIVEEAFGGFKKLMSVTIPSSVTRIDSGAFGFCGDLASITVDKNNRVYDSRDNCNAIIETTTNTLIQGCQKTIIPETVSIIGDKAFYGCLFRVTMKLPDSITRIGDEAFKSCFFCDITVPYTTTEIADNAFDQSTKVRKKRKPKQEKRIISQDNKNNEQIKEQPNISLGSSLFSLPYFEYNVQLKNFTVTDYAVCISAENRIINKELVLVIDGNQNVEPGKYKLSSDSFGRFAGFNKKTFSFLDNLSNARIPNGLQLVDYENSDFSFYINLSFENNILPDISYEFPYYLTDVNIDNYGIYSINIIKKEYRYGKTALQAELTIDLSNFPCKTNGLKVRNDLPKEMLNDGNSELGPTLIFSSLEKCNVPWLLPFIHNNIYRVDKTVNYGLQSKSNGLHAAMQFISSNKKFKEMSVEDPNPSCSDNYLLALVTLCDDLSDKETKGLGMNKTSIYSLIGLAIQGKKYNTAKMLIKKGAHFDKTFDEKAYKKNAPKYMPNDWKAEFKKTESIYNSIMFFDDKYYCNNPVMEAVLSGNIDIIGAMIEKGLDFNSYENLIYTARLNGCEGVVQYLVSRGYKSPKSIKLDANIHRQHLTSIVGAFEGDDPSVIIEKYFADNHLSFSCVELEPERIAYSILNCGLSSGRFISKDSMYHVLDYLMKKGLNFNAETKCCIVLNGDSNVCKKLNTGNAIILICLLSMLQTDFYNDLAAYHLNKLKEFVNYAVNHKWDYKNKNIYGETVMDIVEPAISNIDDIKTILYDGLESTKKSKSKAKESSDDELTFLNVNTGETGAIDTESLKILTSLFGLNNKKKK